MDFATAEDILNDAAVELGLKSSNMADPFGETDQNIVQLCRLLKRVGRQLVRARDWTQLTLEYTFPTVASTASYALPSGYARIKGDTQWNRSVSSPLSGALTSQEWQAFKSGTSGTGVFKRFRVWQGLFWLDPTPTGVETIAYEYVSNFWVVPTGQTAPTTKTPTAITDTLWFDEDLLLAALKLAWRRHKGQDTTAAQTDFNQAWDAVAGTDDVGRVLYLGNASGFVPCRPYLPDTGWGL